MRRHISRLWRVPPPYHLYDAQTCFGRETTLPPKSSLEFAEDRYGAGDCRRIRLRVRPRRRRDSKSVIWAAASTSSRRASRSRLRHGDNGADGALLDDRDEQFGRRRANGRRDWQGRHELPAQLLRRKTKQSRCDHGASVWF